MKIEDIRGALARGYCTERNARKELDADLLEDMTREVMALLEAKKPGDG